MMMSEEVDDNTVITPYNRFHDLVEKYDKMVFVSYSYSIHLLESLGIDEKDVLIVCRSEFEIPLSRLCRVIRVPEEPLLHSKIFLFFSDVECEAIVGSFNLTHQGLHGNVEFFSVEYGSFNLPRTISSTSEFENYIECDGLTDNQVMDQIIDFVNVLITERNKTEDTRNTLSDVKLENTMADKIFVNTLGCNSLGNAMKGELSNNREQPEKILWYISPFHNISSFGIMHDIMKKSSTDPSDVELRIITNGVDFLTDNFDIQNFTRDFEKAQSYFKSAKFRFWTKQRLVDIMNERIPGRFLHGKFIHLEASKGPIATIITSANFTAKVWNEHDSKRNIEAGILDRNKENNADFNNFIKFIWDTDNNFCVGDDKDYLDKILNRLLVIEEQQNIKFANFQNYISDNNFFDIKKNTWYLDTFPDVRVRIELLGECPFIDRVTLSLRLYHVDRDIGRYSYSDEIEVSFKNDDKTIDASLSELKRVIYQKHTLVDAIRLRVYSKWSGEDVYIESKNACLPEISLADGYLKPSSRLRWHIAKKGECLIVTNTRIEINEYAEGKTRFTTGIVNVQKVLFREYEADSKLVYETNLIVDYYIKDVFIENAQLMCADINGIGFPSLKVKFHPLVEAPLNYVELSYSDGAHPKLIGIMNDIENDGCDFYLVYEEIFHGNDDLELKAISPLSKFFRNNTLAIHPPIMDMILDDTVLSKLHSQIKQANTKVVPVFKNKNVETEFLKMSELSIGSKVTVDSNLSKDALLVNWYFRDSSVYQKFNLLEVGSIILEKPFTILEIQAYSYLGISKKIMFKVHELRIPLKERHFKELKMKLSPLFFRNQCPVGIIYYGPKFIHRGIPQKQESLTLLTGDKIGNIFELRTNNDILGGKLAESSIDDRNWIEYLVPLSREKSFVFKIRTKQYDICADQYVEVEVKKKGRDIVLFANEKEIDKIPGPFSSGPITSEYIAHWFNKKSFLLRKKGDFAEIGCSITDIERDNQSDARKISRMRLSSLRLNIIPFWLVKDKSKKIYLETLNIDMWEIHINK